MLNTSLIEQDMAVLLVEDDEVDAKWALRALTVASDEPPLCIERVARLDSAINRLATNNFDLVILDLGLPDIPDEFSGVEMIHNLRPDLPIVVYSGASYDQTGLQALEKGALYYYPKSTRDADRLARTVHVALERHQMQENLRRIINASGDGMAIFNLKGRLLFANPVALDFFGLDKDHYDDYVFPHSLDTDHNTEIEIGNRTAELRAVHAAWNGRPVVLATLRDMTERLSLERQLRQAQKLEAVGLLAGGLAHDFNNILTVISGYVDMAIETLAPGSRLMGELREIRSASDRATSLTRRLLAFSRDTGNNPRHLDAGRLVREIYSMLNRLIGDDVEIQLSIPDQPCSIVADPAELEQVIINLAVNARDAITDGGTVRIETGVVELDERFVSTHINLEKPGRYVSMTFADDGHGMDDNILSHVFEPFFTTKGRDKGTGLGLATVYGIVQKNKGAIFVDSEPGHGTTFRIYFPFVEQDEDDPDRGDASETPDHGTETLLLVEDEDTVRRFAAQLLASRGYRVLEAGSPAEALKLANEQLEKVDLLVTDILMPGMNGKQLADHLHVRYPDLPVLYMSGYTSDSAIQRGIIDKGVQFLQKPFRPNDLTTRIREILDDRAGRDGAG